MKKLIATVSVIAALGGGAFALNAVLPAGATSSSLNLVSQTASGAPTDPTPECKGPRAKFKDVLDGLVKDGTITQDQEDKIIQAFKDAKPAANAGKPGKGPAGREGPRQIVKGMVETAADAIHIAPADLVAALESGKSVADVAKENNVDPATVVQAIVDAGNAKIDQAVKDGKITQDGADKMKSHLSDAATKFVNHTKPQC